MNLILDTNALVNLMVPMIPESHEAMRELVPLTRRSRIPLMVSASSVLDASWILVNGKGAKQLIADRSERKRIARMLRMSVIASMEIEPVDDAVIRRAHRNTDEDDFEDDFEDAVIATVGTFSEANYIITDDHRAFHFSGMIKLTPVEALRYFKSAGQTMA